MTDGQTDRQTQDGRTLHDSIASRGKNDWHIFLKFSLHIFIAERWTKLYVVIKITKIMTKITGLHNLAAYD